MNIRVDLNYAIKDGMEVVFRSPVDCSQVTGLILYYPENGNTASKEFVFADAHGNNVGDIDHLFAENVVVKVILDVAAGMAFVQNADTNAYLEGRFAGCLTRGAVENPATEHYYANLSSAISDINAGTDSLEIAPTSAAVKVLRYDSGKITVKLIEDVSESVQIDISADVDIDLNGHTLYLTTAEAYLNFTEGTNCMVNGEADGSEIRKNGTNPSELVYLISANGNSLKLCGGSYYMTGVYRGTYGIYPGSKCANFEMEGVSLSVDIVLSSVAYAIVAQGSRQHISNSTISVNATVSDNPNQSVSVYGYYQTGGGDCSVESSSISAVIDGDYLTTSSKFKAYGFAVKNVTNVTVKDCVIFADAPGDDAERHGAIGIVQMGTAGTLTCIDTDVTGTHSAAQCARDLYVTGGTFNGYSHGGFYFNGDGTSAYINNACMVFGEYTGRFTDVFSGSTSIPIGALAGFYLGSPDFDKAGISVYMDGCTISGTGGEAFVVRPAKVGSTNCLYISNTQNNSSASVIRLNGFVGEDNGDRAKMEIGIGCNFTADDTTHPEDAKETAMLYRYVKEDTLLDGRDFDALMKGVVSMTDINEKLDAILTSATFSVARGTYTPSTNVSEVNITDIPAGAKLVELRATDELTPATDSVAPVAFATYNYLITHGSFHNNSRPIGISAEYYRNSKWSTTICAADTSAGLAFTLSSPLALEGGKTYEWIAYYWDE